MNKKFYTLIQIGNLEFSQVQMYGQSLFDMLECFLNDCLGLTEHKVLSTSVHPNQFVKGALTCFHKENKKTDIDLNFELLQIPPVSGKLAYDFNFEALMKNLSPDDSDSAKIGFVKSHLTEYFLYEDMTVDYNLNIKF